MQSFLEIPVGRQKIAACLHRPEPGKHAVAAPVVVCIHGLTGTRVGSCYRFVSLARRLVKENIACLRFDARGCGESDGDFLNVTAATLLQDLIAVIETVDHLPGCDPTRLAIVGSSFGAFTASFAAPRFGTLRGLVFFAPVADPRALTLRDMNEKAWEFLRREGWIEHHGHKLSAAFLETLPEQTGPQMLATAAHPLLIFHGNEDKAVPMSQGRSYEFAVREAGVESKLEAIDTSDHGMRSVSATEKIVEGSVHWLRRFLHPDPK
jgi:pimeloyl-ACP methyl ester carboxylesterase